MVGSGIIQPTFVFFLTLTDGTDGFRRPKIEFWQPLFTGQKPVAEDWFGGMFTYPRRPCLTVREAEQTLPWKTADCDENSDWI